MLCAVSIKHGMRILAACSILIDALCFAGFEMYSAIRAQSTRQRHRNVPFVDLRDGSDAIGHISQ